MFTLHGAQLVIGSTNLSPDNAYRWSEIYFRFRRIRIF